MDCARNSRDAARGGFSTLSEDSDCDSKPKIEPDSWRELTEFVDQFDDAVFGVLANPEDDPEGFWIVRDIEKVRPAAIPLGDPPTFDLSVLGPGGKVVDELRLTLDEIEHARAAEPSGVSSKADDK